MAFQLKLTDVTGSDIEGTARLELRITRKGGAQDTLRAEASPVFALPVDATWQYAELAVTHPDYVPLLVRFRPDGTTLLQSDASSQRSEQGGDQILRVPLGRVSFAPGEVPPYGKPTGHERGVYLEQNENRQRYIGIGTLRSNMPTLRVLSDVVLSQSPLPTCILNPHNDDGWLRYNFRDVADVKPALGSFAWVEYGSPATRPDQPRFLIGLWVPPPRDGLNDGNIDMLAFFSPTTANDLYPKSDYPFRDEYPYSSYGRDVIDPLTKEKHAAKVQPYVLLGMKYLFNPTHIVGSCVASGKAPVVVMPIFPRAVEANGAKHMWQPFNSQSGLWRLFLELAQFLEREGYSGSTFGSRFEGAIAPTSGNAPAPPPTFSSVNRKRIGIRDIVISGYSSASPALESLLRSPAISGAPAYYPPKLFGADAAEFDKRWKEFWGLDLTLVEKNVGFSRARFQNALRNWMIRDQRRLRLYQSGWTLEGLLPDGFYPVLRKQLATEPRFVRDGAPASRWSADWRDANGRWSAIFFSGAALRAAYAAKVVPQFPLSDPDGTKGDAASAIHGFAMQLGFSHAAFLR